MHAESKVSKVWILGLDTLLRYILDSKLKWNGMVELGFHLGFLGGILST